MARAKRIQRDYDKNAIFDTLDKLVLSRNQNNILTHYDNRLISNTVVTEKYELFDFPKFAKEVVNEVENYFLPEKYELRITQGQQELRLIGEQVLINGDRYSKMFNILNSTDKSRALQLNVGLIRFICSNGMVVAVNDEHSSLRTKHFKSTMPDKVKEFIESLENFDMSISKQSETIENLIGKFVSFKELASKFALDEHGVINDNKSLKLRAFSKKLLTSQTDKLTDLNDEQVALLKNPHMFLSPEFNLVDIEMPAYKALNCWTEVYRSYDSSVLKRETNRILELI
ncbi:MAG: DUF932 domain-containing protein [Ignavibacteria bacterium]|nr:DUF932 domain-containing protein [Ignavibacteria bacterium]